jgi:epoxyqueuosine reductase QueG
MESDLTEKIKGFTSDHGIDIVEFIDISSLPPTITRGYRRAVLIGVLLPKTYLRRLALARDADRSEFSKEERAVDGLAEGLAELLLSMGHRSYAQSESNIIRDGLIDRETRASVLPHKTVALLSGIGWIGKSDLLVTPRFGSGFCMCTVLTDAPFAAGRKEVMTPQCGECNVCRANCPVHAISGNDWQPGCGRESLVDISLCTQCLRCLVLCPWTQRYVRGR